jgi:predicted peptidase
MDEALRIYDISTEINGQRYACKVMVNEAATLGGQALLFLHGAGECGTEGVRQLHVGLPRYAMEKPQRWPFVIIAPQKPSVNSEWEDHDEAILALLDTAAEMGLYDPLRLGITGLSQGGHGTITIAGLHPDRFKVAAPVCPYVRPVFNKDRERISNPEATANTPEIVAAAKKLKDMPVWLHHGDADVVVPVTESRALFGALRTLGADTRYSEYPDVNHNSWDNAYIDRDFSDWFQEHLSE